MDKLRYLRVVVSCLYRAMYLLRTKTLVSFQPRLIRFLRFFFLRCTERRIVLRIDLNLPASKEAKLIHSSLVLIWICLCFISCKR
jgi:hypothetical protein